MRKLTTEEFITKAKAVHGDKYIYDKSVYSGSKCKIQITCRKHGDFSQSAGNHMRGLGCALCARDITVSSRIITFDDFKRRSEAVHGDTYSYDEITYKRTHDKMAITCQVHGVFYQSPKKHMIGRGCPLCGGTAKKSTGSFIDECVSVHGDKYDYSMVNYRSSHENVLIVCHEHGEFFQTPTNHLSGKGCPGCADYGFKRTSKPAYVYFLSSISYGVVKVGITHDAQQRIKKLVTGTPFQFEVIKIIKTSGVNASNIEKAFHRNFKSAHLTGFDGCTEWLVRNDSLLSEINCY